MDNSQSVITTTITATTATVFLTTDTAVGTKLFSSAELLSVSTSSSSSPSLPVQVPVLNPVPISVPLSIPIPVSDSILVSCSVPVTATSAISDVMIDLTSLQDSDSVGVSGIPGFPTDMLSGSPGISSIPSGISVDGLLSSVGMAGEAGFENLTLPSPEFNFVMSTDGQHRVATSQAPVRGCKVSETQMDTDEDGKRKDGDDVEFVEETSQDTGGDIQTDIPQGFVQPEIHLNQYNHN